jgi:hypothetical protein
VVTGGTTSGGRDPQGRIQGALATVAGFVFSTKTIVVSLAALLTTLTTAISVVFGGGSLALEQAINDERAAERNLANERQDCAVKAADVVCDYEEELCATPWYRNSTEGAIENGFEAGTELMIHTWTMDVEGPQDLVPKRISDLENELRGHIESQIYGNLGVDRAIVSSAAEDCGCFGDEHQYAHLVEETVNSQVKRRALEGVPDLVEKPRWWRDWLLGGGLAVSGLMVGAVLGPFVWEWISRRRATGD